MDGIRICPSSLTVHVGLLHCLARAALRAAEFLRRGNGAVKA